MQTKPKLLDQVRDIIRLKKYSYRTEQTYVQWIRRFILFHDKRYPRDMGKKEVEAFLTYLAGERHVAASTQNQALSALIFLYQYVIEKPLPYIDVLWAKKPKRLPVVLTKREVKQVLQGLSGVPLLVAQLLYGSGLRLNEGLGLRVKDVDFGQGILIVRDGKGFKDRTTSFICTKAASKKQSARPHKRQKSPRELPRTLSATVLLRICWKQVTTSVPSRNYSATKTSKQP